MTLRITTDDTEEHFSTELSLLHDIPQQRYKSARRFRYTKTEISIALSRPYAYHSDLNLTGNYLCDLRHS